MLPSLERWATKLVESPTTRHKINLGLTLTNGITFPIVEVMSNSTVPATAAANALPALYRRLAVMVEDDGSDRRQVIRLLDTIRYWELRSGR